MEGLLRTAHAVAPQGEGERVGRLECRWQRDQLPEAIRELLLDDRRLHGDICWSVFDIVLEGEAVRVTDGPILERLAARCHTINSWAALSLE